MLNVLKLIVVALAKKYAAQIIVDELIKAARRGAESTDNTIDDRVVGVLDKERDFIVSSLQSNL